MTSDTTLTTLTTETQNIRCHLSIGILAIQFFCCYLRMNILTTPNLCCYLSMILIFPMSFKNRTKISVGISVWVRLNDLKHWHQQSYIYLSILILVVRKIVNERHKNFFCYFWGPWNFKLANLTHESHFERQRGRLSLKSYISEGCLNDVLECYP